MLSACWAGSHLRKLCARAAIAACSQSECKGAVLARLAVVAVVTRLHPVSPVHRLSQTRAGLQEASQLRQTWHQSIPRTGTCPPWAKSAG